ncbi:unnamed protein product [Eruca vesicaria subsp. sativa]|uniref:Uncharacterized protein n=1 Tax=Eruca vesicaria subsp. sativa TaxID=29727 RepID=A0ABC8KUU3_ERUVS|nr:unnamed protein product [Eruca vesicaria subsp. sativa]
MSLRNTVEDGDNTLCLQPEDSEISFLLNKFPASTTNVLVVDNDIITLLNMKTLMIRCSYQVMSDDNQIESVMNATKHGACDYLLKPINEDVIANIWKHIVRKRMISKPGLIPPVQLDVIETNDLNQEKDDSMTVDQGNSEQNIDNMTEEKATKKIRLPRIKETQPIQPYLGQSNGSDKDNDVSRTVSQHNDGEQNIDKKHKKKPRKPRVSWTGDLQMKFLQAVDILGGPEKAIPTPLLKCLQEVNIEGLTRDNVASHLQKHHINLKGNLIYQQRREFDWSSVCRPSLPLLVLNNSLTATSSFMNSRDVYPVQENQYHCNNQVMTNTMPSLPYTNYDQHQLQQLQQQQQQYQIPHQLTDMIRTNEPGRT